MTLLLRIVARAPKRSYRKTLAENVVEVGCGALGTGLYRCVTKCPLCRSGGQLATAVLHFSTNRLHATC